MTATGYDPIKAEALAEHLNREEAEQEGDASQVWRYVVEYGQRFATVAVIDAEGALLGYL